jgi:hypothetical membrane protein
MQDEPKPMAADESMSSASTERHGPLVHRSVHHAAVVWILASVQFLLAMAIVQLAWTGHPAYSLQNNVISDLGNTQCGHWPSATSHDVCSPLYDVFNGSIIAFGLLGILGAVLVRSAFPARKSATVGLAMIAIASIGAIGVGASPENVDLTAHSIAAVIAFLVGNLGLITLGVAMFRDTRWDGFRAYSILSGLVGLLGLGLYVGHVWEGLGQGGTERLIVAPILLWLIVVSVHLLRIRQYAPHQIPGASHS